MMLDVQDIAEAFTFNTQASPGFLLPNELSFLDTRIRIHDGGSTESKYARERCSGGRNDVKTDIRLTETRL